MSCFYVGLYKVQDYQQAFSSDSSSYAHVYQITVIKIHV